MRPARSAISARPVRDGWTLVFVAGLVLGTGLFLAAVTSDAELAVPEASFLALVIGPLVGSLGLAAALLGSRLAAGTGALVLALDTALFGYVALTSPIPLLLAGPLVLRVGFVLYLAR